MRCLVQTNSASYGGGAKACSVFLTIFAGNHSSSGGGGTDESTLENCLLFGNSASEAGAANSCALANCTVAANACGGLSYSTGNNCVVSDNAGDNLYASSLNYSCTTPLPGSGAGNIAGAPLFMNQIAGDFHLQTNSPCINAGNNADAPAGPDLDGNPRIMGGTVDMGAYEFQSPPTVQFVTGACGFATNGAFELLFTGGTSGSYSVWASTNLADWQWLGPAQFAASGVFQFVDTFATNWPRRFYRAVAP